MTALWIFACFSCAIIGLLACFSCAIIGLLAGYTIGKETKPQHINIYNVVVGDDDFEDVETPERVPDKDPIYTWN